MSIYKTNGIYTYESVCEEFSRINKPELAHCFNLQVMFNAEGYILDSNKSFLEYFILNIVNPEWIKRYMQFEINHCFFGKNFLIASEFDQEKIDNYLHDFFEKTTDYNDFWSIAESECEYQIEQFAPRKDDFQLLGIYKEQNKLSLLQDFKPKNERLFYEKIYFEIENIETKETYLFSLFLTTPSYFERDLEYEEPVYTFAKHTLIINEYYYPDIYEKIRRFIYNTQYIDMINLFACNESS